MGARICCLLSSSSDGSLVVVGALVGFEAPGVGVLVDFCCLLIGFESLNLN